MTSENRQRQRERRREAARLADLSTVGLVFPVAVVIGYFAGKTVGRWLGAEEAGALAGVLLGVVSGFYNLWKVGLRLRHEDPGEATGEATASQEPSGSRPEPEP
ncbi:MAG TPA: AtpZ/AtpI family protein [Thermoanaerobaculia bacterium]|nr:AtpZ/AtpI family protein [Thermoanaerobaculia bacterium]